MTRIYLVRHAEAEGNIYRVFQGQQDTLLTETGKLQLRALEERFRDIHVDAVYSSDLYRAAATAAAICRVRELPLTRLPALREINVGIWEGRAVGDVRREDRREVGAAVGHGQDAKDWRGGETPEQVRERMLAALQAIACDHDGESVAVVSHGGAIRYVVEHLCGEKQATGQNTGISVLEAENGTLTVRSYNDASHLDVWMERILGRPYVQRDSGLQAGLWYRTPTEEERRVWFAAAGQESVCGEYREEDVLLGAWGEEDAGILALQPQRDAGNGVGWIGFFWMKPEQRRRGGGIQLLGQAVYRYRKLGRDALRLTVSQDAEALEFLQHHGFVAVGKGMDGMWVLEKDIAFRPLNV